MNKKTIYRAHATRSDGKDMTMNEEGIDFDKLSGQEWCALLVRRPDLADRCPWMQLNFEELVQLWNSRPELEDRYPWAAISSDGWTYELENNPHFERFAVHCPWDSLYPEDFWFIVIASQPQFAEWLARQPQVVERCIRYFPGGRWAELLAKHPLFEVHCPWERLDGRDWVELLVVRPEFADRCPWEKLNGKDRKRLLEIQPQFSEKCDSANRM